eukprot:767108-Hanusia_phi.AAC.1
MTGGRKFLEKTRGPIHQGVGRGPLIRGGVKTKMLKQRVEDGGQATCTGLVHLDDSRNVDESVPKETDDANKDAVRKEYEVFQPSKWRLDSHCAFSHLAECRDVISCGPHKPCNLRSKQKRGRKRQSGLTGRISMSATANAENGHLVETNSSSGQLRSEITYSHSDHSDAEQEHDRSMQDGQLSEERAASPKPPAAIQRRFHVDWKFTFQAVTLGCRRAGSTL